MNKLELELWNAVPKELENYVTVWDLFRDYGINKQKTCRYIKSGKLNGVMIGFEDEHGNSTIKLKWYIEKNELLDKYIKNHCKKDV